MKARSNIIGVKEANKDFEQVAKLFDRCGRDRSGLQRHRAACFPVLALGGAGILSATGNVMPREMAELYNLTAAGKWVEARELHYELFADQRGALFRVQSRAAKTCWVGWARSSLRFGFRWRPLRRQ